MLITPHYPLRNGPPYDWTEAEKFWTPLGRDVVQALFAAHRTAETSSIRKNVPYLLTHDDIGRMMTRSRGKCEISGLTFSAIKVDGARKRPYLPSIDRIKAKEPYSPANCRLVCCAVNIAINDWGDAVFYKIALSAAAMRASRSA